VIVNPPFTLEAELKAVLPELADVLAQGSGSHAEVRMLVGEPDRRRTRPRFRVGLGLDLLTRNGERGFVCMQAGRQRNSVFFQFP
jgi:hypothetical protein